MLEDQLKLAKEASKKLANLSATDKNELLQKIAEALIQHQEEIIKANVLDLKNNSIEKITEEKLREIAEKFQAVAKEPDPVGEIIENKKVKDKFQWQKIRCPLGIIGLAVENNLTFILLCLALSLKSGNAVCLWGGSKIFNTEQAIHSIINKSLPKNSLATDAFQFINDPDFDSLKNLLGSSDYLDLIMAEGDKNFLNFVAENSKIPVITAKPVVIHAYVDQNVDISKAVKVIVEAKTGNVKASFSMDILLVHEKIAGKFLAVLAEELKTQAKLHDQPLTEIRADVQAHKILEGVYHNLNFVNLDDYDTKFLDYILSIKVVASLEESMELINRNGFKHAEAILTTDEKAAEIFQKEVDAACVLWNLPTTMAKGEELGLGIEAGFSVQKMPIRGPLTLQTLTSYKWVVKG